MKITVEDKIEELAHEGATVIEDYFDVANGELVGYDFTGTKAFIAQLLHRYEKFLKQAHRGKPRSTGFPILVQKNHE